MRTFAFLNLLSLVVALPAFTSIASQNGVSIIEREVGNHVARSAIEHSAPHAPVVVARDILLDQTFTWPAGTATALSRAFQTQVTNLNNGKFKVEWRWSGAPNWPDVTFTIKSDTGAQLFKVVGSNSNKHGTSEIAKTGSQFQAIFQN